MDYAALIHQIADLHEQYIEENVWLESAALREAAEYIKKLELAIKTYERERTRFKHSKPEFTGAYFISGEQDNKDNNMLPEYITICPAYGCDWSQHYVRTDKTSGPEW
jgi:hypothetical protein